MKIKTGSDVVSPEELSTVEGGVEHEYFANEPGVVVALGKHGDPTALVDFGNGRPFLTFDRTELTVVSKRLAGGLREAFAERRATLSE